MAEKCLAHKTKYLNATPPVSFQGNPQGYTTSRGKRLPRDQIQQYKIHLKHALHLLIVYPHDELAPSHKGQLVLQTRITIFERNVSAENRNRQLTDD